MKRGDAAVIRQAVSVELAKREHFENFHGITAENLEDFLVAPFEVRVDPDDLETQPGCSKKPSYQSAGTSLITQRLDPAERAARLGQRVGRSVTGQGWGGLWSATEGCSRAAA